MNFKVVISLTKEKYLNYINLTVLISQGNVNGVNKSLSSKNCNNTKVTAVKKYLHVHGVKRNLQIKLTKFTIVSIKSNNVSYVNKTYMLLKLKNIKKNV